VETIDLFLLHRADWLLEPADVAQAFAELKDSGKVRYFGISNFRPTLVIALQAACPMAFVAHQVEISLGRRSAFEDGTLDQCLTTKMTPMAWSPLGGGQFADGARRLLKSQEGYQTDSVLPLLDEQAKSRGTTRAVIALAWLLKHPSGILPVVGSTHPQRIREAVRATEMDLSREEWYRLLSAARGDALP
jgi:predicted oxidoreductase